MKITKFFLDRPLLANLITIIIILVGLFTALNLKRATYPNVNFDILKITTIYPGASTEDVEINITNKIEDELDEVQGIDRVRSVSLENLSIIYVFLDLDAKNMDQSKDDIRRAVDRVTDFPVEVDERPEIIEIRSTNIAVIEIAVTGTENEGIMREVAYDLEDNINDIKGVASVEKIGHRKREVKILANPEQLRQKYISLLDIYQTIKNRNVHTSGGSLASFRGNKKIVTFSEFEDPSDVQNVILRSNFSGKQIKIKEIAKIEVGYEKQTVIPRTRMKNSINLLIRAQSNADIIDISKEIKLLVKKTQASLPKGVGIEVVSDFSYYTKSLLSIVKNNAYIGIFLVLVCLIVFLTRVMAFWTAFGIPLSILGAMIFFPFFDISINFISMITMILVLGLLVDDAIVVAENITRHLEKGKTRIEAALIGTQEMFWPVFTTIITSILAFIPIFFMTGVTGKFIQEIPVIVILTLCFSLFECTIILPCHIAHGPKTVPKPLEWFEKVKIFYSKIVLKALKHRKSTLTLFLAFLIACFSLFAFKMRFILFPYDDIDLFYVKAELPEGTPIKSTSLKIKDVEKIISKISPNEMVNYTTYVGHHDTNVYGAGSGLHENWAMVTIYLKHSSDRDRGSQEIMDEVKKELKKLKGFNRLFVEKFNDGPPVGKPITISIVSKNDKVRRKWAESIFKFLENQEGVNTLEMDEKKGQKELRIRPDYGKMARLGITSNQVAQTLRAAFQGLVPTSITRQGEEIDYRVQIDTNGSSEESLIGKLQIPNSIGKQIDLKTFTFMSDSQGYEVIRHYNGKRSITITGDVDGKSMTSSKANKLVYDKYFKEINNSPGVSILFGGEEKATQESMNSFVIAFACALVGIYFVLVILFNSYFQPFIILASIPFGLGGVLIVFYLHGLAISFLGLIGCLGLLGIIVNDGLIMVSHLNEIIKGKKLTLDLIISGAQDRLRAVLLTTITTVSGMIPTIYGFGGSEPFIVPIVLAIAGGLIFATAITLILVPILYSFKVPRSEHIFV